MALDEGMASIAIPVVLREADRIYAYPKDRGIAREPTTFADANLINRFLRRELHDETYATALRQMRVGDMNDSRFPINELVDKVEAMYFLAGFLLIKGVEPAPAFELVRVDDNYLRKVHAPHLIEYKFTDDRLRLLNFRREAASVDRLQDGMPAGYAVLGYGSLFESVARFGPIAKLYDGKFALNDKTTAIQPLKTDAQRTAA